MTLFWAGQPQPIFRCLGNISCSRFPGCPVRLRSHSLFPECEAAGCVSSTSVRIGFSRFPGCSVRLRSPSLYPECEAAGRASATPPVYIAPLAASPAASPTAGPSGTEPSGAGPSMAGPAGAPAAGPPGPGPRAPGGPAGGPAASTPWVTGFAGFPALWSGSSALAPAGGLAVERAPHAIGAPGSAPTAQLGR